MSSLTKTMAETDYLIRDLDQKPSQSLGITEPQPLFPYSLFHFHFLPSFKPKPSSLTSNCTTYGPGTMASSSRLTPLYTLFFAIHLPVMLLMDLQDLYPADMVPA